MIVHVAIICDDGKMINDKKCEGRLVCVSGRCEKRKVVANLKFRKKLFFND